MEAGSNTISFRTHTIACAFKEGTDMSISRRYKKLHQVWGSMKSRCSNLNHSDYKNYGGRNISVSTDWYEFEEFLAWALTNGYSSGLQLDRINNDGNYGPNNCRWVTPLDQSKNRRTTVNITIDGVTKCLSEWMAESEVPYHTIKARIYALNWDIKEALTKPVDQRFSKKRKSFGGRL